MRQFRAIAASVANSTALRLSTGSAPGMPRHTGQTFVFGGAPNRVEHEQKIFVAVSSWTCTSRPMTGSYLAPAATEASTEVDISDDYKTRANAPGDTVEVQPSHSQGVILTAAAFQAEGRISRVHYPPLALVRLLRRAQVLLYRDLEIHQLIPLRVRNASDVDMRARQRL